MSNIRRVLSHVLPHALPISGYGWCVPLNTLKLNTVLQLRQVGAIVVCNADHNTGIITNE